MEVVSSPLSLALLLTLSAALLIALVRTRGTSKARATELAELKERFSPVLDIEAEVQAAAREKQKLEGKITDLKNSYREKKTVFSALVKEAAIYDEEIQLAELGFYKPHFDFGTSQEFKDAVNDVRSRQKAMIKNKTAVDCTTAWAVEGSKTKGKQMINRAIRLTARAFNNECDAAISSVRWNNVTRMEARIEKAFNAINKLNESLDTRISWDYLKLKMAELRLTHEYRDKRQQEKEEQAEIRRQMREEAKLQKELEDAVKEEERYEKLLEKARREAESATDSKLEKLQKRIAELSAQADEAHKKSERAKSMAEQTRSGYVYVISNIGAFGEDIYKIGMTRRLEPMDRVRELGDASVPFIFDTHAMIYSEDAPAVEAELHRTFAEHRVNKVNNRKEFFAVSLDQIKTKTLGLFPEANFIETVEAREYRETQGLAAQKAQKASKADAIAQFPDEI